MKSSKPVRSGDLGAGQVLAARGGGAAAWERGGGGLRAVGAAYGGLGGDGCNRLGVSGPEMAGMVSGRVRGVAGTYSSGSRHYQR